MHNYEAIRLVHRVDTIHLDGETHKRLNEVRNTTYTTNPRCKALARAVGRKSDVINPTEQAFLRDFPEHGIDLGYWSNNLIFSPAICNLPLREHAALVSLVRLGYLGICRGNRDGKPVEILARIK